MRESWSGQPIFALLNEKEEDRFTGYLCHLLQSPMVLKGFLAELCGVPVRNNMKLLRVRTQVVIPNGRPDLCVGGLGVYYLFEAKVRSPLHEEQLAPYARAVAAWRQQNLSGDAQLFLIAPALKSHTLAAVAREHVRIAGTTDEVKLIRWEDIGSLCERLSTEAEGRLSIHLGDFAALVVQRFGTLERPFSAEEQVCVGDRLIGTTVMRMQRLVGRINEVLDAKHKLQTKPYTNWSDGNVCYGYNVGDSCWFGLWIDAWAAVGQPLCVELPQFTENETMPQDLPGPVKFIDQSGKERWVVPLEIRNGIELDDLALTLADVVKLLVDAASSQRRLQDQR